MPTQTNETSQQVVVQNWLKSEFEPGWGATQRPDGYTVHLSMEDCQQFRREFWAKQKERYGPELPAGQYSIYSRESGDPISLQVSPEVYAEVEAAMHAAAQSDDNLSGGIWGLGKQCRGLEGLKLREVQS